MSFLLLILCHFYVDFCLGIWPMYKTWAQIDIATAGLIIGIAGFSAEMLQLVFGYLCDRGYRKYILLLGVVISSAILLVTFVQSTALLFCVIFCVTMGSSSFHPAGMGFASRMFSTKNRTIMFFTAGGALGLGFSQLGFSTAVEFFGGHIYPLLLPLLILVPWLLMHRFPEAKSENRLAFKDFLLPFKLERRSLTLIYLSQVISYGVAITLIFFLPDLLRANKCHPWLCKGGGHLSLVMGSVLAMIVIGLFCHNIAHKKLLAFFKITGIAMLYAFLALPQPPLFLSIVMLVLLGGTLFQSNVLLTAWGHHIIPEHPSTISGLLMGFAWCFSALVPLVAGFVTKLFPASPFLSTMQLIGLLMFLSLGLVALVRPKQTALQNNTL